MWQVRSLPADPADAAREMLTKDSVASQRDTAKGRSPFRNLACPLMRPPLAWMMHDDAVLPGSSYAGGDQDVQGHEAAQLPLGFRVAISMSLSRNPLVLADLCPGSMHPNNSLSALQQLVKNTLQCLAGQQSENYRPVFEFPAKATDSHAEGQMSSQFPRCWG